MMAAALQQLLAADATVTAHLATYDFGSGAEPAVCTCDPAPADCANPCVVVTQVIGSPWGTREAEGGEIDCDVRVWGDKDRSDAALVAAAEAIWRSVNRGAPARGGWEFGTCVADPPGRMTDTDGFPGYLIRVRIRAHVA